MTTTTMTRTRGAGAVRIGLSRGWLEIKQFFRERDSVAFTFLLPVVILALFGAIFGNEPIGQGYTYAQALVPSIMVMGIASTTMVNIGIWIALDRDNGILRRLVLTPMPRISYFIGKILMMLVVSLINVTILVAIGVLAYGVKLPATPQKWLLGVGMLLLSITVLAVLGIALSSLPRTSRSAPAVINMPVLVLYFISGVFLPFNQLPSILQTIASFFPLKWIVQGIQSAFLPDNLAFAWPTESWEHGRVLLVLGAWLLIGLGVCVTTFRWKSHADG